MKQLWKRFLLEEEGATATEYAVMLALIVAISIGTIGLLGEEVHTAFTTVKDEMAGTTTP